MEKISQEKTSRKKWLPLFLTLLLLIGVFWCAWQIWQTRQAAAAQADQYRSRKNILQAERDKLKNLQKLSPCEVKDSLLDAGIVLAPK